MALVAGRLNTVTADETLPSNVSFWPSAVSIVMNDKAFAALTHTQREALEAAGRSALGPSMRRLTHDERTALAVMCRGAGQRGHLASCRRRRRTWPRCAARSTPSIAGSTKTTQRATYRQGRRDEATRHPPARPRLPGRPLAPPPPEEAGRHPAPRQRPDRDDRSTWKAPSTSTELGRGRLTLRSGSGSGSTSASRGAPPSSRRGSPAARYAGAWA